MPVFHLSNYYQGHCFWKPRVFLTINSKEVISASFLTEQTIGDRSKFSLSNYTTSESHLRKLNVCLKTWPRKMIQINVLNRPRSPSLFQSQCCRVPWFSRDTTDFIRRPGRRTQHNQGLAKASVLEKYVITYRQE